VQQVPQYRHGYIDAIIRQHRHGHIDPVSYVTIIIRLGCPSAEGLIIAPLTSSAGPAASDAASPLPLSPIRADSMSPLGRILCLFLPVPAPLALSAQAHPAISEMISTQPPLKVGWPPPGRTEVGSPPKTGSDSLSDAFAVYGFYNLSLLYSFQQRCKK
jgi:hypothetical protein